MKKISFLYLTFLITFCFIHNNRTFFKFYRTQAIKKITLPKSFKQAFKLKKNFFIFQSFITGKKTRVSRKFINNLKKFNLIHLLTPSGLHFSSLFFIFLIMKKKIKSRYLKVIEALICFYVYFLVEGYFSLRRVALLRLFFISNTFLFKNYFKKEQIFTIFFFYELLFGTFQENPLSFIYSMSFLSIFFLQKQISFFQVTKSLLITQMIISYSQQQLFSLLTIIISPLISNLFLFIFPTFILNLPYLNFFNHSEPIISLLALLLKTFSSSIYDHLSFSISIFFLLLIINWKSKKSYLLIISLILIFIKQ